VQESKSCALPFGDNPSVILSSQTTGCQDKIHDKERGKYYSTGKSFFGSFLVQPPYNASQHKDVEKRCQNTENKNKH
jgi:hypothetical protein